MHQPWRECFVHDEPLKQGFPSTSYVGIKMLQGAQMITQKIFFESNTIRCENFLINMATIIQ
jgi:hypothetical protein